MCLCLSSIRTPAKIRSYAEALSSLEDQQSLVDQLTQEKADMLVDVGEESNACAK